jgi:hypothetical protein
MIARCLHFFALAAMSARTKNLRGAYDQQSASVTGPGERSAQEGLEPFEEEAEVVAAGGEHGVGAVALAALEVIALHAVLGLDMFDHRPDHGSALHFAAKRDRWNLGSLP